MESEGYVKSQDLRRRELGWLRSWGLNRRSWLWFQGR